ncbi:MAG: hypothetical protein SFU25_07165 [Candidatus Caenarcaniphilales bacterium]|nr:hypothetical protein [Candidatus Caenarcaniphilales bacterium]
MKTIYDYLKDSGKLTGHRKKDAENVHMIFVKLTGELPTAEFKLNTNFSGRKQTQEYQADSNDVNSILVSLKEKLQKEWNVEVESVLSSSLSRRDRTTNQNVINEHVGVMGQIANRLGINWYSFF